ncbi:MAG: 3-hydroxyacyl-CoA dehydrogenase [Planctomycetota bacterium]|nr:MAG: 3-hydroxyacyl-CoA dehydrogenase [Planctomycetota bacterium]
MGALTLEFTDAQVAVLTIDCPGQKVNTLSRAVLEELDGIVTELESRSPAPHGLLLRSGKPGQFIAGADLNELAALVDATREQADEAIRAGHALFGRVARLPFPTVALIDGACMGGGTELVLCFDDRIASRSPKTKIALPEVKVGLIPGWGGTQRLPRLIGLHPAIEMITSGQPVDAARAEAVGLVFDAVPPEQLLDEGMRRLEWLAGQPWQQWRAHREQPLGLTDDQLQFAYAVSEGFLTSKTKRQYPAPHVALRAIRDGVNRPLSEALEVEREAALEVVGTPISGNLISVFFMSTRLNQDPGVTADVAPRSVGRVGVLGAGLMGSGIAAAHARRGIPTAMVDVDDERIRTGLQRARKVVESRIQIGRATTDDLVEMMALLSTSTSHAVFADCDVVIEAVPENEALKTALYRELADDLKADAILCSNTSTISITRMAQAAPAPDRFIGMHFFNPVDRMALVEVIRGEQTSDETAATIVALAKRIGKTPIVVKDCAGFLVNRILLPYMAEAVLLLLEGADMDRIDRIAERFGMPMGPIALHDYVGLDTAWAAGQVIAEAYADRALKPDALKALVDAGRLGKKSGAGFRRFDAKGRAQPDPEVESLLAPFRKEPREHTDEEIEDRLFLSMLLEAARCVEERVVREPAHVEMGLILGIGFPAFRGGILHWCDEMGAAAVVEKLKRYEPLGPRFAPPQILREQAASGGRFFPRRPSVAG